VANTGTSATTEESLPNGKKAVITTSSLASSGKITTVTIIKIYGRDGNLLDVKVSTSELIIPEEKMG
jgi:hypothetical protein